VCVGAIVDGMAQCAATTFNIFVYMFLRHNMYGSLIWWSAQPQGLDWMNNLSDILLVPILCCILSPAQMSVGSLWMNIGVAQ
jgi:hypothetical protein